MRIMNYDWLTKKKKTSVKYALGWAQAHKTPSQPRLNQQPIIIIGCCTCFVCAPKRRDSVVCLQCCISRNMSASAGAAAADGNVSTNPCLKPCEQTTKVNKYSSQLNSVPQVIYYSILKRLSQLNFDILRYALKLNAPPSNDRFVNRSFLSFGICHLGRCMHYSNWNSLLRVTVFKWDFWDRNSIGQQSLNENNDKALDNVDTVIFALVLLSFRARYQLICQATKLY